MAGLDRPTLYFDTWQYVYERASAKPYVGFEHLSDLPDGFDFDIKRWCSPFDLRLPSMPRLFDPSTQGIDPVTYFKSGVGNEKIDLIVDDIEERYFSHQRLWVPRVRDGWYYRYKTDYFYYGDNSIIQYVDSNENVNGRNYLELTREPASGKPILAASFKRDPESRAITYDTRVEQVAAFTGKNQDGAILSTSTPTTGQIMWDGVDTTKREFVVDRHVEDIITLKFNRDYVEHVGVSPVKIDDLGACDVLGQSTGSEEQLFYLSRFPVIPDSFKLYVVDAENKSWEEWTRVETYHELLTMMGVGLVAPYNYGGNFYYLDRDLGIVVFGDASTGIPVEGQWVVAEYDKTLRVEYEEADLPTDIEAWDADVNPVSQAINQGFVCITHEPLEAANITLSIDEEEISAEDAIFGPVEIGNDWARLIAEVTTYNGTKVPDKEVAFHMTPLVGFLGASDTGESYGVTNAEGLAYSYYQPPLDAESIGHYALSEDAVDGSGWLKLDEESTGLTEADEIYLYQVLKDDPLLGMHQSYVEDYLPDPPEWADPDLSPVLYEQWVENQKIELGLEDWAINTSANRANGRKVIVYQWDDSATNPIDGTSGAFAPVRPLEISDDGSRLRFPAGALYPSDPYSTSASNPMGYDIGGYWVVGAFYVEFWATCWSAYYNRTIESNRITAKVILPRYLLGEHVNEQLQKLPFGWKIFRSTEYNHAAGLDGATFLTINPQAGPYEILTWYNGGTTDEWAQAIMSVASFSATITS